MSRRSPRTGRGKGSGKVSASSKRATPAKRQKEALREYRAKRRAVAPLVSFEIPLDPRPADKAKLTRYHKYLFGGREEPGITQGVRVKVRKKDPKHLEKLQRQLGQGKLRGVKYAFVPSVLDPETDDPMPVRVRTRKTGPDLIRIGEGRGQVGIRFLPFDKAAMMDDWRSEVIRVRDELLEYSDPDSLVGFRIRNGTRALNEVATDEGDLLAKIKYLMTKYDSMPGRETERWLDGLFMEEASSIPNLQRYLRQKEKEHDRKKRLGRINLEWARMLKAVDDTHGGAMTEVLSRIAYGIHNDPSARSVLESMARKKLVTGGDARWMLTRKGNAYLRDTESLLPIFKL